MKLTKGFTLIELMIVVAIIGILAVIAIPSYQEYAIQAKLSEPLKAISTAKPTFTDHYATVGAMPNSSSPIMTALHSNLMTLPTVINANSSNSPGASNEITIHMTIADIGGSTGSSASNQLSFRFIASDSGMTVDCSPTAGTTIAPQYLPNSCRN